MARPAFADPSQVATVLSVRILPVDKHRLEQLVDAERAALEATGAVVRVGPAEVLARLIREAHRARGLTLPGEAPAVPPPAPAPSSRPTKARRGAPAAVAPKKLRGVVPPPADGPTDDQLRAGVEQATADGTLSKNALWKAVGWDPGSASRWMRRETRADRGEQRLPPKVRAELVAYLTKAGAL